MFKIFIFPLLSYFFLASPQLSFAQISKLKKVQDSSHIYMLPFEQNKKVWMVQGPLTIFSHKNDIAYDFKVKKGTIVCAARSGIVVAVNDQNKKGGYNIKYLNEGNYVIMQHNDGSQAFYWHLQFNGALVKQGDTVIGGNPIGKSGNVGYSAFPHLHFEVQGYDVNNSFGQLPVRFYTNKGVKHLKSLRHYRRT